MHTATYRHVYKKWEVHAMSSFGFLHPNLTISKNNSMFDLEVRYIALVKAP
jgi:hypothetical protein